MLFKQREETANESAIGEREDASYHYSSSPPTGSVLISSSPSTFGPSKENAG